LYKPVSLKDLKKILKFKKFVPITKAGGGIITTIRNPNLNNPATFLIRDIFGELLWHK
jgi:hypothetical protein